MATLKVHLPSTVGISRRHTLGLAGALLLGLLGSACAAPHTVDAGQSIEATLESVERAEPAAAPRVYTTDDIAVQAPASGGWALIEQSSAGILFAKGDQAASDRYVAKVTLFELPPTETPEAFQILIQSKATEELDLARFEVRGESFRDSQERAYPCARYQSIATDRAAPARTEPLVLEIDALYCRHPDRLETGFSAIFSHLGQQVDPKLRAGAEAFIQGVRVVGGQRR